MIRRIVAIATLALGLAGPALAQTAFQVPVPAQRTLANGLRVVVFPRPGAGVVQVQLLVPAGTDAEKPNQEGAAALVSQLLRLGTSSRDAETFTRDLEALGGNFRTASQRELSLMAGAFLPGDLGAALELMSDAAINPLMDEAQFNRARNQAARELLTFHTDAVATATEQLWAFALPQLPAARPPLGTLGSIFNMTRDPLRAYHRDHYRPNRAVLALAGDVTAERAFAAAEEWFGRWSGQSAPPAATPAIGTPAARALLVNQPDLPVAAVRVGWSMPGRGADDELARTLGVRLLEQRLQKRLSAALPGRPPVDVNLAAVRGAGLFSVGFVVPAESVGVSVPRVRRAVREAMAQAPGAAEFEPVQRQLASGFPLRFETLGGLLSQWMLADLEGNVARLASEPDRIRALTPQAVAEALRRGFDAEAWAVVAVGPADQLRAPLAKLGPVREVTLDEPPAPTAPAVADTLPPVDAQSAVRGRAIAAQVVDAHGGVEEVRRVKDSLVESRVTLVLDGRELLGDMRQIRAEPFRMVFLTKFESFESRQVLNGDRAWSVNNDGELQDADSVGVRALRSGFHSDVPHLLQALADSSVRVEHRGRARFANEVVDVLDFTSAGGERRRLYASAASHLLLGMDLQEEGGGGRMSARRYYRDLRPVNGLKLPFEEERQLEGRTVMRLYAIRVNTNIRPAEAEFLRPSSMPVVPKK